MINLHFPAFYFMILPNRNIWVQYITGHYVTYVSYITICYHTPAITSGCQNTTHATYPVRVFLGTLFERSGSGLPPDCRRCWLRQDGVDEADFCRVGAESGAWGLGNCWANASEQVQYGAICTPSAKQFHCLWHHTGCCFNRQQICSHIHMFAVVKSGRDSLGPQPIRTKAKTVLGQKQFWLGWRRWRHPARDLSFFLSA